jgi:type IV pilus assembly protein PilV
MKNDLKSTKSQSGVVLLEALIAILIFSLGIMTVVAMQATSVKLTGDAKYRSDATMAANQLVGQMWASGLNLADLKAQYQTGGTVYQAWFAGLVNSGMLPGVAIDDETMKPQVSVIDAADATGGRVTITIFWRTPQMSPPDRHRHVLSTQIARDMINKL